jgi:hypothetical protein
MKIWPLLLLLCSAAAGAADVAALVQDRTAIERVYYNHRLGQKPPLEEALPPATLEDLVRLDLKKEAVLCTTYGVTITPALLGAEVQRINTTTRAPEMLTEIKAALGNDPVKFAQVFAKPFLVDRLLRDKFDNDDALHGAQRREVERVREKLLSQGLQMRGGGTSRDPTSPENRARGEARPPDRTLATQAVTPTATKNVAAHLALLKAGHSKEVSETTWQLGARPAETNSPAAEDLEIKRRFGPEAQIISSPRAAERDREFYFEELPGPLQNVMRAQLRQPGEVSAVIETPGSFLLYLCTARTTETLSTAVLSLPKGSYDQWLAEQKP